MVTRLPSAHGVVMAAGLMLAGLVLAPPASAQCSVPGQPIVNFPGSQSTLQAAIDATANGGCILVGPGTYVVNLQINNRYVEIKASSADPAQTVLDGGNAGSVVVFQNVPFNPGNPFIATARISGFTIQHGNSISGQGGGITLANQADVLVSKNVIKNNVSAVDGGGIVVYNRSHATIIDNTITGNSAPRFGGGLFVVGDGSTGGGSNPIIFNNTISNNFTTGASIPNGGAAGGGIFVDLYSSPYIIKNTFTGNSAPFAGGAIMLRKGVGGYIEDNTITGNSSASSGGIHAETEGTPMAVQNNTITGNHAVANGSFAISGVGGGISAFAQSQPFILQNTISGNTATYAGAGIYVDESATAVIEANRISGNVVSSSSGPIGPPAGGGIWVANATASMVNNVIDGNSAAVGGGIGVLQNGTAVIQNNTIVKNAATLVPQSATVKGGGGLFVQVNGNGSPATNTTARNNIFDLNIGVQIFEAFAGGATYDNNLVNSFDQGMYFNYTSGVITNIGTFNAVVAGSGNVSGPNGFVNAAGNDFHLTGSSAAINQGTPAGAPAEDFSNRDRPAGGAFDIGAYEFTGQTVVKSPIYRFFSLANSVHFYTQSKGERDFSISIYPYRLWRYEGVAYETYPTQVANTIPVHRAYSSTGQSHFYGTDLCELFTDCQVHPPGDPHNIYPDNVWHYEQIAFYVYPVTVDPNTHVASCTVPGSTPVYRFFSPVLSHHFYTNDENEKNFVIAHPGNEQWQFEGPRWCVPGS